MKDERTVLDVASVGDAEGVAALVGLDAPTDPLATVPAEEQQRILAAADRAANAQPMIAPSVHRDTIRREVAAWHAAHRPALESDREIAERIDADADRAMGQFTTPETLARAEAEPSKNPGRLPAERLTEAELAEIERLDREATPGPWEQTYAYNNAGMPTADFKIPAHNGGATVEILADDAALIVAYRTAAPRLAAEVRALRAEQDEAHAALDPVVSRRDAMTDPPLSLTVRCATAARIAAELAVRRDRDAMDTELARAIRDTLGEVTHDGVIERLEELLDVEKESVARPTPAADAPSTREALASICHGASLGIEADALAEIARKALDAAPAADASLEARGEALGRALCAKLGPGIVAPPAYFRAACIDLVRAVDASRPAAPEVDAEDLWTDYRTGRGTVFASDRKAFLAGVAAGRRTREPDMGAADASRPGLTGDAWTALAQVIATLAENDSLVDDAIAAAERAGCPDATVLHLHEINDAMYRRRLRGSRPGLTEEQADAIALGCLQVREDLQRHAIKRAILRASRGETGPATEPTRAERVAEAQRLRAEARAEAEACTVPMPADLLARYPRSADPPQPDRPSGLTRAMHDAAQQRPSVAPDLYVRKVAELRGLLADEGKRANAEKARADRLARHARALGKVARITLKGHGYYGFRTARYGEADALRARDRKSRASRGETGPAPTGLTSFMADAQQRPSVPPASPFGEWPEPEHDGDPQKTATLAGAGTGND